MNKLSIKLISIDLFQTLVRLDDAREEVWKAFLRERFSSALARQYWDRTSEVLLAIQYETATGRVAFKNIRSMMEESYAAVFREINCAYSPSMAAGLLIDQHKRNFAYADAAPFLQAAGQKYPVCLSTDADSEMITCIRDIYPFDRLFVSEEMRVYKHNPAFFKHVMEHYGLEAGDILHIGDSQADILTPKKLGLQTCWLNRDSRSWQHQVCPDYQVKSLMDILKLL